MNLLIQIGKLGLLLSAVALCAVLAWSVIHVVRKMDTVQSQIQTAASTEVGVFNTTLTTETTQLNQTLARANTVLSSLNATVQIVNRPCGSGHPCGTLADVAKTLNTVRGTFGQIEIAANHENANLTTLDTQERTLFADLHTTLQTANTDLTGIGQTSSDIDAFVKSPELASTTHNMATITGNFAQTSTDFQTKFHDVLFPPPCKGKLCVIKKVWPYIRTGTELLEPTYYGYELLQAIH